MMKKTLFTAALSVFSTLTAYAALPDDKTELIPKRLKEDAFVVSTDDESASDSLDRISGQFDLGYTSSDQTYKSPHHYRPGPFGKAAAEEAAQNSNY